MVFCFTSTPNPHLALLRCFQETLRRRLKQCCCLLSSHDPTRRRQNVLVSIRHPDAIVVIQQHLPRLLTALRTIIELEVIVSLFLTSPPSPIANTSSASGYMSAESGDYLIVDRMEQRHQRVQRAIDQEQLPLLQVKHCLHQYLAQCWLVVRNVLEHLHANGNPCSPQTRRGRRYLDRDIRNGSERAA